MLNAIAAFGLGYLFFKFVQENGAVNVPDDSTEENTPPPTPYDTGKQSAVLTSVYENGGYVLYKLDILQGQAYEDSSGNVTDETYYQTVGYVVGDVSQSGFTTQNDSAGAYTFEAGGVTQKNVTIYTESSGKAYIDEKTAPTEDPEDPVSGGGDDFDYEDDQSGDNVGLPVFGGGGLGGFSGF